MSTNRISSLRVFTFSLVFLMMGAGRSVAGVNIWTRGGPDGGSITAIVPHPTDDRILYLGTGGGVFRSTDGGAHWMAVNEGMGDTSITALAIRGDEPSTLFAATLGHLYRTSNSGGKWSELTRPTSSSIESVVYDATNGSLYAAAGTSVLRSDDEGVTWQTVDWPSNVTFVAVPFGGAVYAGSASGLSVSGDRGATWKSVAGVTVAYVNAMAADPETGMLVVAGGENLVFRSRDRGKSWQALPMLASDLCPLFTNGTIPAISAKKISAITTLFIDGSKVIAATCSALFEISEGATTWQLLRVTSNDPVLSIGKSSSRSGPLFAGTLSGLLKKTGDSTWTYLTTGLTASNTSDIKVIAANPLQAFVATMRGLYKTTDGAQTWQAVPMPGTPAPVRRVAPSSTSETVFASRDDGLLRSTDAGESWKLVLGQRPSAIAIAPSESSTMYADLASAMSKSTNGGETWTAITTGLPEDYYFFYWGISSAAIAVHPTNPETVYLAQPDGIFKTVDGGGMWQRVYDIEARSALVIDASDPSNVYAALDRGVVKSLDGGNTWLRAGLDGEEVQTLAIDPAHPSVIYAGTTSGRVFRSANRGDDWAPFDLGLHGAFVASLAISPSGDLLYAATSGGVFTYQRDRRYLDGAVTYSVALRTYHSNYLSAAHCGDREVNGAAASAGPCETFTLYDVNGGVLMDGDTVYLQAPNGSFVAAENGGAGGCIGCESPLNANRAVAGHWETFTIHRAGRAGRISDGDGIILQAYRRDFVAAEPDGRVNANRGVPREWETFILMMR